MATITLANPTTKGDTLTRRLPDGTILALASDGISSYRIDLNAAMCECAGFSFRGRCRHLAAAQARYGEQACPVCAASPLGVCPSCANAPKPAPSRDDVSDLYN